MGFQIAQIKIKLERLHHILRKDQINILDDLNKEEDLLKFLANHVSKLKSTNRCLRVKRELDIQQRRSSTRDQAKLSSRNSAGSSAGVSRSPYSRYQVLTQGTTYGPLWAPQTATQFYKLKEEFKNDKKNNFGAKRAGKSVSNTRKNSIQTPRTTNADGSKAQQNIEYGVNNLLRNESFGAIVKKMDGAKKTNYQQQDAHIHMSFNPLEVQKYN